MYVYKLIKRLDHNNSLELTARDNTKVFAAILVCVGGGGGGGGGYVGV